MLAIKNGKNVLESNKISSTRRLKMSLTKKVNSHKCLLWQSGLVVSQTGLSLREQGGSVSYVTQLTQTEKTIPLRLYSPRARPRDVINGDLISGDDHVTRSWNLSILIIAYINFNAMIGAVWYCYAN